MVIVYMFIDESLCLVIIISLFVDERRNLLIYDVCLQEGHLSSYKIKLMSYDVCTLCKLDVPTHHAHNLA